MLPKVNVSITVHAEWVVKWNQITSSLEKKQNKTKPYASFPVSPTNLSRFLLKLDCYYEITYWRICFCSNADVWTMLYIGYSIDIWFLLNSG